MRNSSFSDSASPGNRLSAVVGGPTPAARQPTGPNKNKNSNTLQSLVHAANTGRAPSSHNLMEQQEQQEQEQQQGVAADQATTPSEVVQGGTKKSSKKSKARFNN